MSDDSWVSDLLANQPPAKIPADVAATIDEAIAREAAQRQIGAAAGAARQIADLQERSTLGSFGANGPSHYDKSGVGITERHPSTS